jgi:hypothetical protein
MATIKITGKLVNVFPVETFGTFEKRIIWVDEGAENFNNVWEFELWKADVQMVENYSVGDVLTFSVDVRGKKYFSNKTQKEAIINSLKCWNITKEGSSYKEDSNTAFTVSQSSNICNTVNYIQNNDRCF